MCLTTDLWGQDVKLAKRSCLRSNLSPLVSPCVGGDSSQWRQRFPKWPLRRDHSRIMPSNEKWLRCAYHHVNWDSQPWFHHLPIFTAVNLSHSSWREKKLRRLDCRPSLKGIKLAKIFLLDVGKGHKTMIDNAMKSLLDSRNAGISFQFSIFQYFWALFCWHLIFRSKFVFV